MSGSSLTSQTNTFDTQRYHTDWKSVIPVSKHQLKYSASEWKLRCKLACGYRVAHNFGWTQNIFNHITAKVPDSEQEIDGPHFLINPLGLRFDEITACSLIKVTIDGVVKDKGTNAGGLFRQGFVIHAAVHAVRHDITCVWHCHHEESAAISMTKTGILPLCQEAISILPTIAYHPFEGTANDMSEQPRIQKNLGNKKMILMLDNHGPLTLGRTVDEAFTLMYGVCRSCSYQQKAIASVGGDLSKLNIPSKQKMLDMAKRAKMVRYKDGAGVDSSSELVFRAMCRVAEEKYGIGNIYDIQEAYRHKLDLFPYPKTKKLNSAL